MGFYDRFLNLCNQKGMSPSAVTRENGLNNSISTAWKRGAMPSGENLQKLADYFGVTVDYLLGSEKETFVAKNSNEHPKAKLRSISRLEDSEITPEQDEEISRYIDYLLSKRGKG